MIGVLVASHSEEAARGITKIAEEMSGQGNVPVLGVGGNDYGGLGLSIPKVYQALVNLLAKCDGVLIVPDIGSSVLSSRAAVGMLPPDDIQRVAIANAPILEGAMLAAIESSAGSDLAEVHDAATEAKNLNKSER